MKRALRTAQSCSRTEELIERLCKLFFFLFTTQKRHSSFVWISQEGKVYFISAVKKFLNAGSRKKENIKHFCLELEWVWDSWVWAEEKDGDVA